MSVHRENVTWRSADGTWSRAFYDFYPTGNSNDDDYDSEWDVEYTDEFNWVSTGHPTEQSALQSWDGPNPGGSTVYGGDSPADLAERQHLDDKAWDYVDRVKAELAALEKRTGRTGGEYRVYGYRPRDNDVRDRRPYDPETALRRLRGATTELAKLPAAQESYRLHGYSNDVSDRVATLTARREDLRSRAEAAGVTKKDLTADDRALVAQQVEALDKLLTDVEAERAESARRSRGYYGGSYGRAAPPALQPTRDLRDKFAAALPKPRATRAAAKTAGHGAGRVAAGVPTGGQFATAHHTEADVRLV